MSGCSNNYNTTSRHIFFVSTNSNNKTVASVGVVVIVITDYDDGVDDGIAATVAGVSWRLLQLPILMTMLCTAFCSLFVFIVI